MKVRVNPSVCQGHSMCTLACPEMFQLNDEDGHASAVSERVPQEFEEGILFAQRSCPEQAIEVEM